MTTKLSWRLGKLPTPSEVRELLKDKIITQEEAREVLFKSTSDDERDSDSLKEEIKFLRGLIDKLSDGQSITIYKYVHSYPVYPWVTPYTVWSSAYNNGTIYSTATNNSSLAVTNDLNSISSLGQGAVSSLTWSTQTNDKPFSDIQTF